MKKELINEFTVRITQSNKSQLVVVLYDMTLEYLKEAKSLYESGDIDGFVSEVKKAQKCIAELMSSLDMQYKMSVGYMKIYIYISRMLVDSAIKRKPVELDRAEGMIVKLRDSYKEATKNDNSAPLMGNAHQVYAGMTYGKGTLNEMCDSSGMNRGFTV